VANFVHIADERDKASIERNGLKLVKAYAGFKETEIFKRGVFALPVIENFIVSHQWLRELKRGGFNTAIGVYFKIPDTERVWAGLYNQPKQQITAAEAVCQLRTSQAMGFEVVIPRTIKASEIRYTRVLPQTLGWRYFPDAKGKPPFCGCSYCQRGNIKSRRIRERYESELMSK
jgi:hypothetical protein